jgi:polyisoprenoid-binding protein YceI
MVKLLIGGALIALVALGLAGYAVLRTPEPASGPIQAIPLTTPTAVADTTAPGATILQIVPSESQARFVIDEVLNNAPKTVVGSTEQVAGEIAVDPQDVAATRVGTIQINARTLTTDNDFRNRALKNQILQTDQYEFISFTPTAISGLPSQGMVGQSYTFQITGDLTIRDVTRTVTFDVTARAISTSKVQGTATATIRYVDFGISIPQVPQVASVADTVRLELDFTAAA